MRSPNDGERLPSHVDFAASLALSEASGVANAQLIAVAYRRARDCHEDARTALLAVIRTEEGMRLWEEARRERLDATEAMPGPKMAGAQ